MDALSEVLKVVQLNGAIFFNAHFTAPWCVVSPAEGSLAPLLDRGGERIVLYHYVVEGSCLVTLDGMSPVTLNAGDIVVFPQGDAHTMASSRDARPQPLDAQAILRDRNKLLELGGGGATTRFVCGYLACDPRLFQPVLAALPPVVTMSLRRMDKAGWLEASLQHAVQEAASPQPGAEGVLAKLSEVMVVETLRQYVAQLEPGHTGWLSGLRDRAVGRCLALMHEKPAHPWTVDALAREVALSRSVLAERFTHYVGQSPMQYLGRWRMALATNFLRRSALSLARIAELVGYETDAAFSRAFRREFGVPPAAWRRLHAGPP
ncbi:MAG: AraC family transcriptional regulator [Piscinibacter sp.]|nr:AraC family transcriptional regulator [Piscinibacter sp.]